MMKKEELISRAGANMESAYNTLLGQEAKAENIAAKHGRVPAQVLQELDEAEMEYGYWKAVWKDNRHDPHL